MASELDISVVEEGGVAVVTLVGPVDSATLDLFTTRMNEVCASMHAKVLLNCEELTYMNSRAIGLLMKYQQKLMRHSGQLVLCSLNRKMVRTFDLLHIGKTLVLHDSKDDAMAALQG